MTTAIGASLKIQFLPFCSCEGSLHRYLYLSGEAELARNPVIPMISKRKQAGVAKRSIGGGRRVAPGLGISSGKDVVAL
jgi:hypothetical protein